MLLETFCGNAWVRSVADRLAVLGYPTLAVSLYGCMAPDLAQGRRHKEATSLEHVLGDVAAAFRWLQARHPKVAIHAVRFCFGGHAAFLAATLPRVEQAFDFYGAGVS